MLFRQPRAGQPGCSSMSPILSPQQKGLEATPTEHRCHLCVGGGTGDLGSPQALSTWPGTKGRPCTPQSTKLMNEILPEAQCYPFQVLC